MPEQRINEAQASAIEHASGPLQVLAGPGSGKTYLTIRRIRHLILHHGISPDKILVITFTKAAAGEMKERFMNLTEHAYPTVHFGTFHAVYFHILKQSGYAGLTLATSSEQRSFLKHILRESGNAGEENPELYENLLKEIGIVKAGVSSFGDKISPSNGMSLKGSFEEKIERQFPYIYNEYCRIMQEENKIDFDDMILLCDKLFDESSDILFFWQNAFSHILVDEFQDISPLQYRILRRLALPHNNLFVVGDDDQSIYGFRGANSGIMKVFMDDYTLAKQIVLNINYRCDEEIVKAAGIVISENSRRFKKDLLADKRGSGIVKITAFPVREEEHRYLLENLKEKTVQELSESAVICRTNAEASTLSRELAAEDIPFYLKERLNNIFEEPVSKDIFSYLSFACGVFIKSGEAGGKRSDFFRIMNKPLRYVQRQAASLPVVTEILLLDYYKEKPYMQETVKKLWSDLRRLSGLRPYLAIDYIRNNMGYEEYLLEGKTKEKREELRALLDEIQNTSVRYRTFEAWSAYAKEYTELLDRQEIRPQDTPEGIRLLTMHMSKGLEYTNVYLPDISTGRIPNRKSVSPEAIEEERRLLYVAMTRAKECLEILYCKEPSFFIIKLKEVLERKA